MFKKKTKMFTEGNTVDRNINSSSEVNASEEVPIPVYAPNMCLTPKEYQITEKLCDLERNFKSICMEFLLKAEPDEFNQSYMDAVIERTIIDAIRMIRVQRVDHERLITIPLNIMHKGDYHRAKDYYELYLNRKAENEKELIKYRTILWEGTSLAEGGMNNGNEE